jgi:large subunit ribosomal protein L47
VASVGKGKKGGVPEGPLRSHLGVEVNPNHGLWAFFRKKDGKDGVQSYETLEAKDSAADYSGMPLFHGLDVGFCALHPTYLC